MEGLIKVPSTSSSSGLVCVRRMMDSRTKLERPNHEARTETENVAIFYMIGNHSRLMPSWHTHTESIQKSSSNENNLSIDGGATTILFFRLVFLWFSTLLSINQFMIHNEYTYTHIRRHHYIVIRFKQSSYVDNTLFPGLFLMPWHRFAHLW